MCREMEIPVPNPINAGWMAGHAEEEGGYWYEGKRKGRRRVGGDNGAAQANDSAGQSVLERHGTFANKKCLRDKFIHSSPV